MVFFFYPLRLISQKGRKKTSTKYYYYYYNVSAAEVQTQPTTVVVTTITILYCHCATYNTIILYYIPICIIILYIYTSDIGRVYNVRNTTQWDPVVCRYLHSILYFIIMHNFCLYYILFINYPSGKTYTRGDSIA